MRSWLVRCCAISWDGGIFNNNDDNNNSNNDEDAVAFGRPPAEGSALGSSPPAAAASAAATSAELEETGRLSRRTDVKVTSACDKGAGIRLGGEAFL